MQIQKRDRKNNNNNRKNNKIIIQRKRKPREEIRGGGIGGGEYKLGDKQRSQLAEIFGRENKHFGRKIY